MTVWTESPLRPHGQAWPGLNTRGGRLDNGRGQLEDGSFNQVINEADILEKRRGLVRGLEEWFPDVVCGLFKYTDTCGVERLLVASTEAIAIRSPFEVPVFEQSDAYPFDSFATVGAPSDLNWRNITRYTQVSDALHLDAGAAAFTETNLPASHFMRWFKQADSTSYQVRVEFAFDSSAAVEQRVGVLIKGVGDLSAGSWIKGDLIYDGTTMTADLYFNDGTTIRRLLTRPIAFTSPEGFFTVQYSRNQSAQVFTASFIVVPTGGAIVSASDTSINAIQDANFGGTSAIALGYKTTLPTELNLLVVDGGPV